MSELRWTVRSTSDYLDLQLAWSWDSLDGLCPWPVGCDTLSGKTVSELSCGTSSWSCRQPLVLRGKPHIWTQRAVSKTRLLRACTPQPERWLFPTVEGVFVLPFNRVLEAGDGLEAEGPVCRLLHWFCPDWTLA